jgi:hypothetical protein
MRIDMAFELELAVGASYIAFVRQHGSVDLKRFLLALAGKLHARGNNEVALAVRKHADAV